MVRLPALRQFRDHTVDVILSEFALVLRALRAGHEDVPVLALRLDSLRELQYVTQAFVFNDRALSISVSRS